MPGDGDRPQAARAPEARREGDARAPEEREPLHEVAAGAYRVAPDDHSQRTRLCGLAGRARAAMPGCRGRGGTVVLQRLIDDTQLIGRRAPKAHLGASRARAPEKIA